MPRERAGAQRARLANSNDALSCLRPPTIRRNRLRTIYPPISPSSHPPCAMRPQPRPCRPSRSHRLSNELTVAAAAVAPRKDDTYAMTIGTRARAPPAAKRRPQRIERSCADCQGRRVYHLACRSISELRRNRNGLDARMENAEARKAVNPGGLWSAEALSQSLRCRLEVPPPRWGGARVRRETCALSRHPRFDLSTCFRHDGRRRSPARASRAHLVG